MKKWTSFVVAMLGIGCGDDAPGQFSDAGIDGYVTVLQTPATPFRDLDLLFVIDNSTSMADKQARLVDNFPVFIAALESLPAGMPNLHLAVVTTDMGTTASESPGSAPPVGKPGIGGCGLDGDGGRFLTNGAAVKGSFVIDVDDGGERVRNYEGSLSQVFSTMAAVGATGCGSEQPLRAMRAALTDDSNSGFLREDALLGVVFLTDEDDCSLKSYNLFGPESTILGPQTSFRCTRFGVTCSGGGATPDAMNQVGEKTDCTASTTSTYLDQVAPYRDFLVGLKGGDVSRVAVAAIMGPPEPVRVEQGASSPDLAPSCSYQGAHGIEVAAPGVRLNSFVELFPNRAQWTSICQHDLAPGLAQIAERFKEVLGYACLDPAVLADVDPGTPGLQYDCIAEDVRGETVTEIAPCGPEGPETCWSFDAQTCERGLALSVTRPSPAPVGTITRLRCITQ